MTDEAFVFTQDVHERRQMKTGAMHKKSGAKSKKCTMPSDYLSTKEKKKLNGTCISIKLNEPFRDWKAFRHLPDTMQAEYIQHLVDNYDGSQRSIAEMLGTNQTNFCSYLKRRQLHITFKARGGARNIKSQRFEEFLNGGPKKTDEEIINERFGIDVTLPEPEIKSDQLNAELYEKSLAAIREYANETPVPEPIDISCPFDALMSMKFTATGYKDDLVAMLSSVLGTGKYKLICQIDAKDEAPNIGGVD